MQRSDAQGWFQAGGHLALFTATGVLAYLAWSQQIWILFALLLLAHGTVGSFLVGVAPHELGHGTVFRTKALNKLFLYLFSLLSWWDQFDTPLPAAARQVHSDSPDKLESSIGELAPNALA